jgi:hypothetical protein
VIEVLRPLLARYGVTQSDEEIVAAFQDIEAPLCERPYRSYRTVLAIVVEGFGQRFAFSGPASGVSSWQPQTSAARPLSYFAGHSIAFRVYLTMSASSTKRT